MIGLDDTAVVEEEAHAAGLAEGAGLEKIADFRRGAVPVVGETLDDDGHLVRREALIDDRLVGDLFVGLAGAFLDGALDGVPVHGGLLGLLDGGGQARVRVRVRAAEFGGDHDFADQFDDQLAFLLRVGFAPGLFPLCAHRFGFAYCETPGGKVQSQIAGDWRIALG